MRTMRAFLAAACAVALLAAGCGGTSGSSGSKAASLDETASLAPRDAGLWVAVDTSGDSSQWAALRGVLARIPGASGLLTRIAANSGSGNEKLDLRRDVRPALGPQAVVVVPAGASEPVLLAKPDDHAKLERLLDRSSTPHVEGRHDGWTVVATTQKALSAYLAALGNGTLTDSDSYAKTMDGLASDALVRLYADGSGLTGAAGRSARSALGAVQSLAGGAGGIAGLGAGQTGSVDPKTLAKLGSLGLAVSAGDGLVRVDGSWTPSTGGQAPTTFEPTLLRRVPSDALAAISFAGSKAAIDQARTALAESGGGTLKQIEEALGVSFDDLLGLADGQGVAYVRPALLIPELTIVLEPADPAGARRALDAIWAKLAKSTGATVTPTTESGVRWQQLSTSGLTVAWGADGNRLVLTTAPQGYSAFKGDGERLVDAAGFKKIADDVGLGDATAGFAYVDVNGLAPLVRTLGTSLGSGPDASVDKVVAALSGIDAVAVNATVDGTTVRFQGVLRVTRA